MPEVKKGQSKNSFISECVQKVMKEGKSQKEALGQCYGMWEQKKKKSKAVVNEGLDDESLLE